MARFPVHWGLAGLAAYSNRFADVFSAVSNQAALAAVKKFSAGVSGERRFLLKSLNVSSVALALPTGSGNFGWRADYAGDQAQNETALGFAYARNAGSKIALGVQFNYTGLKASGYGSASALTFDLSVLCHLGTQWNAGFHVYNPVGNGFGKEGTEQLPFVYAAGLGYDISPQVFLGVEAEKMEGWPPGINAVIQYRPADQLFARLGLRSATAVFAFGFGVQLNRVRLEALASLHPYLGTTPGLSILYAPLE